MDPMRGIGVDWNRSYNLIRNSAMCVMYRLNGRLRGRRLSIEMLPRDKIFTDDFGPQDTPKLLAFLVAKAITDGMLKLRLGVKPDGNESYLQFYGLVEEGERIWWNVNAPPADLFPHMLELVLSAAKLDQAWPVQGVVPAVCRFSTVDLRLEVPHAHEFTISWPGRWAWVTDETEEMVAPV